MKTLAIAVVLVLASGCSVSSKVTQAAHEAGASFRKIRFSTVPVPQGSRETDEAFAARVDALRKLEDDTESLLRAIEEAPSHD